MGLGYLKNIFFKVITTEDLGTTSEQGITDSSDYQETTLHDTPQYTPENAPSIPTSLNLMRRFFRIQKLSLSEPPEILHENEAWAPDTETVGLFRKRRVNVQEQ